MKIHDQNKKGADLGRRIKSGDRFDFRCHPEVSCFNLCCRNLNLFLYPYDVLRLKNNLGLTSDLFLDRHVDVVLREGQHFPEVLLKMASNEERTCPFLTASGCSVYPDRPDTCRTFPIDHGESYNAATGKAEPVYFFRPPDFCMGQHEKRPLTIDQWMTDQEAKIYHAMTRRWADIRRRCQQNPWSASWPNDPKAKMAFMAAYNIDAFKTFVFESSFLQRYRVKKERLKKIQRDDKSLLLFGFDWILLSVWNVRSKHIRLR
jgi:Fe-S-cluster containining protein